VRVLAIDPGLKTGVALFNAETLKLEDSAIIDRGLPGIQEYFELGDPHYDVLVVESFELEEGSHGIDLTPVGIIDWFKTLGIPIVWQRRNQRGKGKLISVPVLKRAGLYPKRGELKEGHQVAALQHALNYLVRQRHLPTIRLLHPPQE
jgi:hypothetical protein